jgi:hypothetical protein
MMLLCCAPVGMMICVLGAPDAGITTFFEVKFASALSLLRLASWLVFARECVFGGRC